MEEIKLVSFTTLTQDGRLYVAADEVTNLLRALALLYETRSQQDTTAEGTEILSILTKELGYLCLLYTSPSPRDLSTSRMPSSA